MLRTCRRAPAKPRPCLRSAPTRSRRSRCSSAPPRAPPSNSSPTRGQSCRSRPRARTPRARRPPSPPRNRRPSQGNHPGAETVSSPPSGAFTPRRPAAAGALRALPTATDVNNPSAMSYAPAKIEPAPLTAIPDAKPAAAVAAAPAPKSRRSPRPRLPPRPKPTRRPSPPPLKPLLQPSKQRLPRSWRQACNEQAGGASRTPRPSNSPSPACAVHTRAQQGACEVPANLQC